MEKPTPSRRRCIGCDREFTILGKQTKVWCTAGCRDAYNTKKYTPHETPADPNSTAISKHHKG